MYFDYKSNLKPGDIDYKWSIVRCGICEGNHKLNTIFKLPVDLANALFNLGWEFYFVYGWVCPKCQKAKVKCSSAPVQS